MCKHLDCGHCDWHRIHCPYEYDENAQLDCEDYQEDGDAEDEV